MVAIGHKILVYIYYALKKKEKYKDLGKDYLQKQNLSKKLKYYQKQIALLGYDSVILQKPEKKESVL